MTDSNPRKKIKTQSLLTTFINKIESRASTSFTAKTTENQDPTIPTPKIHKEKTEIQLVEANSIETQVRNMFALSFCRLANIYCIFNTSAIAINCFYL